jgi:hypothetical protein
MGSVLTISCSRSPVNVSGIPGKRRALPKPCSIARLVFHGMRPAAYLGAIEEDRKRRFLPWYAARYGISEKHTPRS